MSGDHFWLCLEALATIFDGDEQSLEAILDDYARHVAKLPHDRRTVLQCNVDVLVGGLARLSLRLRDQ